MERIGATEIEGMLVDIVYGFLGSGKTTFITRILEEWGADAERLYLPYPQSWNTMQYVLHSCRHELRANLFGRSLLDVL
jgi:hypothetical protein